MSSTSVISTDDSGPDPAAFDALAVKVKVPYEK